MFDNATLTLLNIKAKEYNADYVTYLTDDILVLDPDPVDSCFKFLELEENKDCGYVRMLKYEYDRMFVYDKYKKNSLTDIGNCIRHFNDIENVPLKWEKCGYIDGHRFFKNNWHWTLFPSICRATVFDKIIFKSDCPPLQEIERLMMYNYHDLKLKTGVLDLGAVSHIQGGFSDSDSCRVKATAYKKPKDVNYKELLDTIDRVTSKNKKAQ